MSHKLSATIRHGLVNKAGITPQAHRLVEALLEDDRERHHCYFNDIGFHNHSSHHLLAAYDLGASAKLLQAINDDASDGVKILLPIRQGPPDLLETVTLGNWTEFLGKDNYYVAYLDFFLKEIEVNGAAKTLESFIFNPEANGNGSKMFSRFLGGLFHPMIQIGYGAEFGSDAMVAQGIAQVAVHPTFIPALFEPESTEATTGQPSLSLFEIIRQFYASDILVPVMPYDANISVLDHVRMAAEDGRPAAIRALVERWFSEEESNLDIGRKHAELTWFATLQLAGTGRPGREPRPDFFLMHVLTSSFFLPSLDALISHPEHRIRLLKGFLAAALFIGVTRGRPRINPNLLMSYTATPAPPKNAGAAPQYAASSSALGDPNDIEATNPWDAIIESALHAPESHIVKAVRVLYYAAQKFGATPAGGVPGALDAAGDETITGMRNADGTVFVRAAGVLMDQLGWVAHGQEAGSWDGSGLGWEAAWDGEAFKPRA
ncbi:hypothetical protein HWV62_492 [Athelia sp. TMB]|nr:hypothetical protein HWV62_492 [Athelia sp. TMB]